MCVKNDDLELRPVNRSEPLKIRFPENQSFSAAEPKLGKSKRIFISFNPIYQRLKTTEKRFPFSVASRTVAFIQKAMVGGSKKHGKALWRLCF